MINSEIPDRALPNQISTRILNVVVYTNQALVTRRGVVTLTGEERELIICGLPVSLQPESVRARGAGTLAVQLRGVNIEYLYTTVPVAARLAQLTQQIADLEQQILNTKNELAALMLQRNFVQSLGEKSVEKFSQSLARQNVSLEETKELLNFIGQEYNEYQSAITQKERNRTLLEKQLQANHLLLKQIETPQPLESYNLTVAIEPAGAGDFELEVSYIVTQASWKPLYDLRVDATNQRLNLDYLAEVQQNSGEDWLGALTLSTAKPGLGTLPPQLDPWYIDIPRVAQLMRIPARRRARRTGDPEEIETEDVMVGASLDAADFTAAESVAATVATQGSVVNFQINGDYHILSDGTPHKITIFNDDYPCRVEYIAIPKLVSFAYLQATVINSSNGVTLLSGKANIFRDRTFVGTTQLANISPGQEFKLNLGIDEGLKIERDLVERQVDKKLLSNQRRTTYAYRIFVTNLRNQQADLRLTEQLPISRNEQIKVRLTTTNPQIQQGEMGILEWAITLSPLSKREIYYQFTVEYPRELTVIGLDI